MGIVLLRAFGLLLLTLSIGISGCQAVFPRDAGAPRQFQPGFVQEQ